MCSLSLSHSQSVGRDISLSRVVSIFFSVFLPILVFKVPSLFHFPRDASKTKLPSQLLREIYIMRSLSLRPWAVVFASGNEGEAALEI